jgi:tetratricopeptide (TPR) repeat protein
MAEELDLPDEVFGFGNWLLWRLATRATALIDGLYATGPARPSRRYGMAEGHPVPTPSLVAWLLTAAESGTPLERLAQRDPRLDERQKVLRTLVSRAIGGEPHLFKDGWLRDLAMTCGLSEQNVQFLMRNRDDEGFVVEPEALRTAIARTLRAQPAAADRALSVSVDQVVTGEIPREPPAFVTRGMMNRLADAAGRGRVAVVCAVTGLRGVGKTQLAAAYARARVGAGCGLVGWVNAETPDTLMAGLARIADRMGVADPEGDSLESARRLREHLQTRTGEGLLIFDNATNAEELRPFLPATGGTQIVITSTDQAFTELGEAVDVAGFSRGESLGYLQARTGLADEAGAVAVAHQLGDLPLGLAQAAATIRRQHLSYSSYLERLRRAPVQVLLGRIPGGDYPRPAAAALLLSIEATETSDPTGLTGVLLRAVAALSPDGISRSLLDGLASDQPGGGEEELDGAVERCVAGSLLSWSVTGDAVIMHRLLARVLRERDQADGRWAETVQTVLDLLEPQLFPADQAWARREEGAHLAAQAEALWEASASAAHGRPELPVRQLQLRSWGVAQLVAADDLSRAIDLGTRVLADCQVVLGPTGQDTLTAQDHLAEAYASAGRLQEAIPLHETAMADRQRVLGASHPDTLTSQNHLAHAYRDAGRLEQAISLYEQTAADRKRVLGSDHPDTLTSRNDLAHAYESAGRLEQAITLYEQTAADRERLLGADHPDTLTSRDHLAGAHESAGQLGEAIPLYERTLADRERVLGSDHPDVLETRTNLAYTYQSAGRLEQAIQLFERALADHERVLGGDHPGTLITRNNLAVAYRTAGRLEHAIQMFEQTLADYQRIMGADDLNTLIALGNLGDTYQIAGRLEEAMPLLEKTLADRERVLGNDHPHTLTARSRLAGAYASAGRLDQAIEVQETALADRERVLGADHPQTFFSQDQLARIYALADRADEAIALFEKTLADRQRVLGADNPETFTSRDHLADAYRSVGRLDLAIPLFEGTLADRERILGADHPDTAASRVHLERARQGSQEPA